MRGTSYSVSALALAAGVNAFPAIKNQLEAGLPISAKGRRALDVAVSPGFDAASQYVSTTGEYAFVAPTSSDARGPCPGLNAMANHGYIPHNGVATNAEFISGTFAAFGMSADLSGFLTVVGSVLDGDGLSWSIGGPTTNEASIGLLGTPQGISGSHNKYESDASPTRGDLYLNGNDYALQLDQFTDLYNAGQANGDNYTLDVLNEFRSGRWDHSLQNNPYFFSGPFPGVLVAPAAFEFIYRFMGNKSAEYPEGYLNGDVLMSFFSVTKNADGSFTHTPGNEKIPDNWYKRAIGDEYTIPYLNLDTIAAGEKYPKFLSIGGNTGTVNSFVGLDFANLTAGAYDSATLLEGNNLACFAMQGLVQLAPDLLFESGVLADVTSALSTLTSSLSTATADLSCPNLVSLDAAQFSQFPGYSKMNGNGTY